MLDSPLQIVLSLISDDHFQEKHENSLRTLRDKTYSLLSDQMYLRPSVIYKVSRTSQKKKSPPSSNTCDMCRRIAVSHPFITFVQVIQAQLCGEKNRYRHIHGALNVIPSQLQEMPRSTARQNVICPERELCNLLAKWLGLSIIRFLAIGIRTSSTVAKAPPTMIKKLCLQIFNILVGELLHW